MAIERCLSDSAVEAILVDPMASNARARRFYERHGFQFIANQHVGADDCAVYRLTREDWPT